MALTEEQEILQRTAREFVQSRSPLSRLRALRDADAADGFSRELWAEMARLGWLGIVVPEQYGGAGLGWTELMVVLEELGRGLVPEPMMGTVLLGATTLLLGGSEAQRSAHLPAVVAGEQCLALAYQEPASRYAHQHVETRAERSGGGWTLGGQKVHVLDGQCADWFIVSARTAGAPRDAAGVSLFLVPRDARGLGIERQQREIRRRDLRRQHRAYRLGVVARGQQCRSRRVDTGRNTSRQVDFVRSLQTRTVSVRGQRPRE